MHTGLACPTCEAAGTLTPLMTGSSGYQCNAGHRFSDTEELQAMKLTKLAVPPKLKKPTVGQVEFKVQMNPKLLAALQERFKEGLGTATVTILTAILDSGSFLVTGSDVDRFNQLFGTKVTGPSQLFGLVFNLKSERDEARKEAEALKAQPVSGSAVQVNETAGDFVQISLRLGVDEFMSIKEKAKFNNEQVANYMAGVISHGLQSGWF